MTVILASASPIRAELLRRAGVRFETQSAPVDEEAIRAGLAAEQAAPRDMADVLAEAKARRVSGKRPEALVIGADQVLEFNRTARGKFADKAAARAGLLEMQGQRHMLHSAAVIYENARPIWRHVSTVRLQMRPLTPDYIDRYLNAYWDEVSYCAGGYRVEAEGVRLFSRIEGDFFAAQGLPLLEILSYLALRQEVET